MKAKIEAERLLGLGFLKSQTGQIQEAVRNFNEALACNPEDSFLRCNLFYYRGVNLAKLMRFKEAESDFENVVRLNPEFPIHGNRGVVSVHLGKLQQAISDLTKALTYADKADLPKLYFYRACAWECLGDRVQTVRDCKQALELKPDFKQARAVLERNEKK